MRIPTLTVPVITVLLISTGLVLQLGCFQFLVSFPKGRVFELLGIAEGVLCCANLISWLNEVKCTTHPGCGVCSSLLPYLWLVANFDLSMRASWAILKPVVANPVLLTLTFGSARTDLVMFANVLACRLSALFLGIKPE